MPSGIKVILDEKLVCAKFLELKNSLIGTANFFKVKSNRIKEIVDAAGLSYKKSRPPILIKNLNLEEVKQKYQELGQLTKVSQFYNCSIEAIRQLFIQNNIEYTKSLKYECDHQFFSRDTEGAFYWAGFLAADGGIEKVKPRIKLELKADDRDHIQKFKNDIKAEAPIIDTTRHENRPNFLQSEYYSSSIRITSKQIVKDLKERFNVGATKSFTYQFPIELKEHPLIKHYIRGLIDGDGWIYHDGNQGTIGLCGTKQSVEFVFNFLKEKLDLESGYTNKAENKELYSFNYIKISDTQKIVHYLYDDATIWLDRKKIKADLILTNVLRKIELDRDILIKMTLERKDREEMAKELGCSWVTLTRRLKEYGIIDEVKKEHDFYHSNESKLLSIISKDQLLKDLEKLKFAKEVSEKYGITEFSVNNAIKKCGLDSENYTHKKRNYVFHKNLFTKETLEEAYNRLKTKKLVAKEFGVNSGIICYWTKKFNIEKA